MGIYLKYEEKTIWLGEDYSGIDSGFLGHKSCNRCTFP
ncbi:ribonuclease PH [Vibrio sp. dhg]|nr:ribonuclease PH [Vibrio sp. dhg]